jgi:23S rRNA pseudouridine1911/1915/1917 synthase
MASLKHPLVADSLYGGRALAGAARQLLHARALSFDDYASGRRLAFESPLAQDFQQVLEAVSWLT